jgi:hypothetical protein
LCHYSGRRYVNVSNEDFDLLVTTRETDPAADRLLKSINSPAWAQREELEVLVGNTRIEA